ncbi:MAG: PEGA domain-containing protein, partial [Candidatus Scalindua sp.]|nr:PEGA domain-containing protein [Candidatus Scalindua sp.]
MIDSVPASATIYLDGKKTGTTPDTLMSATPGIHKIEVKMDGYEVWSKMVNVKADKNKALTAALQKMAGSISIESEPAKASIFIDGKEFGRTPAMRKSIDHGKHEVEVRMEGYKVWSKIVNLKAGKEKLLTATLQIMSGVIRIESTPTKARIYLDGEEVGTTPDSLRSIAPGTHEVKVKMEGYKVWSKELDV